MKDTITELKQTIKDASTRQAQAKQDVKRIEKDMNEFKNNKDSKLQQLQKQVDQLKAAVKKQDATIKAKHKEFQTLQLETGIHSDIPLLISEQLTSDLTSSTEQVEEATSSLESVIKEVESLEQLHTKQKACPNQIPPNTRTFTLHYPLRWNVKEPESQTLTTNSNPSTLSSAPKTQPAPKAH